MRILVAVVVALALAATATAQQLYWVAGLDFVTPIAAEFKPFPLPGISGTPGALINRFGYDNATGTATVLYVQDACFETWQGWPVPGHGDVIAVVQTDVRMFYLLHADGYLKPEPQPQSAWCLPVVRGK